jgi:transposase
MKACPFNRHKNKNTPIITNISDKLWNIINSTLPTGKPNNTVGRPIVPFRKVMDGILYVLRTECQWKMLLLYEYGSGSTCHRQFQEWVQVDIFKRYGLSY